MYSRRDQAWSPLEVGQDSSYGNIHAVLDFYKVFRIATSSYEKCIKINQPTEGVESLHKIVFLGGACIVLKFYEYVFQEKEM